MERSLENHKQVLQAKEFQEIFDFVNQFDCDSITKIRSVYRSSYNSNFNFGLLIRTRSQPLNHKVSIDSCQMKMIASLKNWPLFDGVDLKNVKSLDFNESLSDSLILVKGVAFGNGYLDMFLAGLYDVKPCEF